MSQPDSAPVQLKWYQYALLALLAICMRIWGRTLRFYWGTDVDEILKTKMPPSVVIAWHNRLFAAPAFYRRYFRERRLASLISASKDGAWLAAFFRLLGMRPVRGSRHHRGAQAFRELLALQREGCDITVTPDGSRGPMYDMKPGAVALALKTGAPIVLLSFNHSRAWRLKSWDRFFIPYPFSRIEVRVDRVVDGRELGEDPKEAAVLLKKRMDAITLD